MFTVTFPLDIGTEVELSDGSRGTVAAYGSVIGEDDNDFTVWVSGMGEPWGGEYLLGTEEDRNSPNKEFYCFAEIHDVV